MRRRHALVVGIDEYPAFGPEDQLFGAVRDAEVMAEALIAHYGFAAEDVLHRHNREATRDGILDALEHLRSRICDGDQVVFFFSGHGSQMTDREQDEGDGLDETLVPFDSGRASSPTAPENRDITDDEINHWATQVLAVTPHLTLIFDCCHAATLHRPGWRMKSVPPDLRPIKELPPSPVLIRRDVDAGPQPLMIAACRNTERAWELPPSATRKARGAFSLHFVQALREAAATCTVREIISRTKKALRNDCPEQHPELSGESLDHPFFSATSGSSAAMGLFLLEQATHRPDRFGLEVKVYRSGLGAWRPLNGVVRFWEGNRLRIDIRHLHARELFVYLLDVGLSDRISLVFPDPEGHESLDQGLVLRIGQQRPLRLFMPENLPEETNQGTGHLVILASPLRLVTSQLLAEVGLDPQVAAVTLPYQLFRTRHSSQGT